MENLRKQPPIIRFSHLGYIIGGVSLVVSALIAEPYLHRLNAYVIIVAITLGLLIVEGTLVSIIYQAYISKKTRLNQWSGKNRFLALIAIIFAFIWTLMLFEISKGVYFSVFAHKI